MLNYLLTSGLIHSAILLSLCLSPDSPSSQSRGNIEVNILESSKKVDQAPILPKLPTSPKYAKLGRGASSQEKEQEIDLTDYANQLKSIVDPVWVSKISPYQSKLKHQYEIIVLLFVQKSGKIRAILIKKGSGDSELDKLALDTFREIGNVPIPPESVVEHGIEWDLVF